MDTLDLHEGCTSAGGSAPRTEAQATEEGGRTMGMYDHGTLTDVYTGDEIRPATREEAEASAAAAEYDGGAGVICIDSSGRITEQPESSDRRVYVA